MPIGQPKNRTNAAWDRSRAASCSNSCGIACRRSLTASAAPHPFSWRDPTDRPGFSGHSPDEPSCESDGTWGSKHSAVPVQLAASARQPVQRESLAGQPEPQGRPERLRWAEDRTEQQEPHVPAWEPHGSSCSLKCSQCHSNLDHNIPCRSRRSRSIRHSKDRRPDSRNA